MLNIIDEFFYNIDKKEVKEKIKKIDITKDEALDSFLSEIELYLGDYAKERSIKSSQEILELCTEYEDILSDEDIFYYYKGFGKFLAGEFKEALENANKAIKMDDDIFDYHILKGKVCEKLSDETNAIISFIKALELNPKSIEGLKKLGFIYMSTMNIVEGLACFDKAYILEKEDAEIYSGLAGCNFEIGEMEKAHEYITKAIVLEGTNANYYYNRAIINRVMGNNTKSIKDYKKTIELEPAYTLAYFYLADLYIQLKEIEEARDILEEVLMANDTYADAHMKISYCYILENKIDKAFESLTRAIELEPTNIEFYYKRAALYVTVKEEDKALIDYNKIIELDSSNAYVYDLIAKMYMEIEDYSTAKEFLEKGLEVEQTESFYGNIAICEYQLKNLSVAKELFTKSIEMSSQNAQEDYFFRGKCSYYLNEDNKGKADFEKILELGGIEAPGAMYYLAYIAYSQGEFEKTVEYINDYAQVDDTDYMMLRMLSSSYSEIGEYRKAREVLLDSEDIADNLAELYNDIALSYFNEKNIDKALEFYDEAVKEDDKLALVYSNRALAKEYKQNYKSAIKDYEKAITLSDDVAYHFGLAECYDKLSNDKKVLEIYEGIVKTNNDNIMVIGEIAGIYHQKGEYKLALDFYDKALKKETNVYIRIKRISLLFDMKEFKKGIKDGEVYLKEIDKGENLSLRYDLMKTLASAYRQLNKIEKEISYLEKCLEYEPLKVSSLESLIKIYKTKNDKKMLEKYKKML